MTPTPIAHPAARPFDDTPLPGAGFGESVRRYFARSTTFSWRASRAEYWNAAFLQVVVVWGGVLGMRTLDGAGEAVGAAVVAGLVLLWALVTVMPTLALNARRLHDVNLAGWWQLVALAPYGWVALVVVGLLPPRARGERFDEARPAYVACAGCERCG
ncbi:DUF805 domain-containing protein [Cellulomonas wangsupingiae]|uniref:DUF805 domain-containing protein n=1 Tax=Cellulomonas wangsupingiae TaxID=2968085 RepID=UPI001D0E082C|nr:DUF805 domain-containing protein [Cellulomonas wangsupingiae]MCM0639513.1 DUF805 domain-containing protein [Cellulomonas wangsupingiae]